MHTTSTCSMTHTVCTVICRGYGEWGNRTQSPWPEQSWQLIGLAASTASSRSPHIKRRVALPLGNETRALTTTEGKGNHPIQPRRSTESSDRSLCTSTQPLDLPLGSGWGT